MRIWRTRMSCFIVWTNILLVGTSSLPRKRRNSYEWRKNWILLPTNESVWVFTIKSIVSIILIDMTQPWYMPTGACNWQNSCMMTITSTSTRSIGLRCYPQVDSIVRQKTYCFLWSQKTFRPSWCNTIITPWHGCITIGELSAKGLNSRRKCKIKKDSILPSPLNM